MSQTRVDLIPDNVSYMAQNSANSNTNATNNNASFKNRNTFSPLPSPMKPIAAPAGPSGSKHFTFANIQQNATAAASFQNRVSSGVSVSSIDFGVGVGDESDDDNRATPVQNHKDLFKDSKDGSGHPSVRERTENEVEDSRNVLKSVSNYAAKTYLLNARPILAAAQLLAVEDVQSALTVLTNNGEVDLAYAVAMCFEVDATPYVVEMAEKSARLGVVDLAVDILCSLPSRETLEVEVGLFMSRHVGEEKCQQIIASRRLRPSSVWMESGREEENIGSDSDAVLSYTIARKYTKAATLGLKVLTRFTRSPWELTVAAKKLIRALKYIKAVELEEPLRLSFLCHMLWFSAHEAFVLTLYDTSVSMLTLLVDYAFKAQFVVPSMELKFQLLFVLIYARKKVEAVRHADMLIRGEFRNGSGVAPETGKIYEALESLSSLLQDKHSPKHSNSSGNALMSKLSNATNALTISSQQQTGIRGMQTELNKMEAVWGANTAGILREISVISDYLNLPSLSNTQPAKRSTALNLDKMGATNSNTGELLTQSVVQGSLLPAANQKLKTLVSAISSTRILGSAVQVGASHSQDQAAYASANEVAAWRRVNPFSPAMTGE
eukprot:gene27614-34361_t